MPHGYTKKTDTSNKVVFEKTHRNGETTRVIADKVNLPDEGDRWTPSVEDEGRTASLGKFKSKQNATNRMKQWMRSHPKGLQSAAVEQLGGGLIDGKNNSDSSGLFGI